MITKLGSKQDVLSKVNGLIGTATQRNGFQWMEWKRPKFQWNEMGKQWAIKTWQVIKEN
jgi:hypothetical protein